MRYKARLLTSSIFEREFGSDDQRVCLRILKVSEESLGRDETPRQTSHELFSHKYLTILLLNDKIRLLIIATI